MSRRWAGLRSAAVGKGCRRRLVRLVMIASLACGAGEAGAGGVMMIVGGMRDAARSASAPTRGVMLTFDTGNPLPDAARDLHTSLRVMALAPLVGDIARACGLDAALLLAVIHAESAGDPRVISPKGAVGLMQLMPATGAQYGLSDPFDARQNILAGARFLGGLLHRYRARELALAAYNAGEGAIARHGGRIPPYDETRAYVAKVLRLHARYARDGEAAWRAGSASTGRCGS